MAQPPTYNRAFSFQNFQALNPSTPLPADSVDLEYNRIKQTLDAILANIVLIQRDDGALANQSVGRDQLAASITVGFNVPSAWLTSTAYVASDTVFEANVFYVCLESHTSGVFATDLAADKWEEIADFNVLSQSASLIIYSNATSGLAAENAQDAIDELASEKLDKSGGTMTGAIGMGSNKITSLGNATADGDALNRITADGRFQPLDADLTAIAALTPSNDDIVQRKAGAWTNRTMAQLAADLPAASTTAQGAVELATDAEAQAKSVTGRSVTPSNLAALGATDSLAGLIETATQAEMETGTDTGRAVTPGRQHFHPAHPKCWLKATVSGGTPTLQSSYNITGIADGGAGILDVTVATDFSSAHWCCNANAELVDATMDDDNDFRIAQLASLTTGSVQIQSVRPNNIEYLDPASWHMAGFGDQA